MCCHPGRVALNNCDTETDSATSGHTDRYDGAGVRITIGVRICGENGGHFDYKR